VCVTLDHTYNRAGLRLTEAQAIDGGSGATDGTATFTYVERRTVALAPWLVRRVEGDRDPWQVFGSTDAVCPPRGG
jgi:hypothetical protein